MTDNVDEMIIDEVTDQVELLIKMITKARQDERQKVLAEVESWANSKIPGPCLVKRLCYKEDFVAELRAKLAEMVGTSTVVDEPKGER